MTLSIVDTAFVDFSEAEKALDDIEERAKRLAPAFVAMRKPMREDQRAHAKQAEGPGGGWPPRAAITEERRRSKNRRVRTTKAMKTISPRPARKRSTPRRLLGRLPGAVRYVSGSLFLRVSSLVAWSGAHARGGRVGHNRSVTLPKRTFLWMSDRFLTAATGVLATHIMKGWKRR